MGRNMRAKGVVVGELMYLAQMSFACLRTALSKALLACSRA